MGDSKSIENDEVNILKVPESSNDQFKLDSEENLDDDDLNESASKKSINLSAKKIFYETRNRTLLTQNSEN